jgi:hypothetical protein
MKSVQTFFFSVPDFCEMWIQGISAHLETAIRFFKNITFCYKNIIYLLLILP